MGEPQITVGMSFGKFSEMKAKLSEKFYEVWEKIDAPVWSKRDYGDEIYSYRKIYKDNNGKEVSISGNFSALIKKSVFMSKVDENLYKTESSIEVKDGNLYYYAKSDGENTDSFNCIISDSKQIAIDINGNGIVDEGEFVDLPERSDTRTKVDYNELKEKLKNIGSNLSVLEIRRAMYHNYDFMELYNELEEKAEPGYFVD